MNEEEAKKIIDNMSEQELNDFIFFALKEVEKENQKLKTELEKKDKIIDLMAKSLIGVIFSDENNVEIIFENKEELKQYFENQAKMWIIATFLYEKCDEVARKLKESGGREYGRINKNIKFEKNKLFTYKLYRPKWEFKRNNYRLSMRKIKWESRGVIAC